MSDCHPFAEFILSEAEGLWASAFLVARNDGEGLFLELLLDDNARYNLAQRPIIEELRHRGEE